MRIMSCVRLVQLISLLLKYMVSSVAYKNGVNTRTKCVYSELQLVKQKKNRSLSTVLNN